MVWVFGCWQNNQWTTPQSRIGPPTPLSALGQGGPYPSTWARPLSTIKQISSASALRSAKCQKRTWTLDLDQPWQFPNWSRHVNLTDGQEEAANCSAPNTSSDERGVLGIDAARGRHSNRVDGNRYNAERSLAYIAGSRNHRQARVRHTRGRRQPRRLLGQTTLRRERQRLQ